MKESRHVFSAMQAGQGELFPDAGAQFIHEWSDPVVPAKMEALFARLARSRFRQRFRLGSQESAYCLSRGMVTMRLHAADFIAQRLAPANLSNDGRQTPMRGHPVFVAQHATATCCRGCLEKWHGLPLGRALSTVEQAWLVDILMAWIAWHMKTEA